jgi:uncharacterized membrane protein YfhO
MIYRFFAVNEDAIPTVYLSMKGVIGSETVIKNMTAYALDMESLQLIYEELEPLGMVSDSYSENRMHGTVTADNEHSVLFTSIPYDIGWNVSIDGIEVATYAVYNGAFLACDITPGMHELEFVYKDDSLLIGFCMFGAAALLLILLKRKDSGKRIETEETVTSDDIDLDD